MSEINLEEFERRLRAASSRQSGVEDPLAELTRLVDTMSTDHPPEEKVVEFSPQRLPKAERLASPAEARRLAEAAREAEAARKAEASRRAEAARQAEIARRAEAAAARRAEAEARAGAAIRAGTPPPVAEAPPEATAAAPASPEPPVLRPMFEEAPSEQLEQSTVEAEAEAPPSSRAPRATSWYLKVGGLTALAAVMAAGAILIKVGMPGRPKTPPMILAAEGPTKVAPPTESAVQSPSDSGALLLRDSAAPAPVKLVSKEEQPVDLGARPAAPPTPVVSATPTSVSPPPTVTAALPSPPATSSPIAPTADTPVVANSESAGPAVAPLLSTAAKPVKTVSVRPDGTLISVDTPEVAPSPAAAAPPAPFVKKPDVASAPQAATPTIELPQKPTKSLARGAIAKTDTTVPADSDVGPPPTGAVAHGEKPAKIPTKLRPPAAEAAADPNAAADPAPAEGGGWAVQFAAPRSDADAENEISRLKGKYADALGGASLAVHKADVHGETLYRVRAGGLSKADASALCSKVKAAGGDCFLAKH